MFERVPYYIGVLLKGATVTVGITLGALAIALALGLALAVLRTTRLPLARPFVRSWVEVFRDIPPLTQLFIIYFGLTYVGIRLDPFTAAVVGLGLNGSAYCAEIFRSGFSAVHHGQREAAASIGMTPMRAMRFVVFPQAFRVTLPPLANYAIGLIKDTAVASAVAAPEILFRARNLTSETFETPLIYLLVAILYFCLTFPIARLVDRLEARRKAWA
ncbi:MAG: amino acid ABC transporter permease [Geminicoccaceae bacterium]|nr:amino acid ABC transporter permease [Geminicoccaceae bacterium]